MQFILNVKGANETIELFQTMATKVENPPVEEWELLMLRSADQTFVAQGRPVKWPALDPKTIQRRKNKDKSSILILRDTEQLHISISPGAGNAYSTKRKGRLFVWVGTNRPGASNHQEGVTLPQRKFLLHQPEDVKDYKQVYLDSMLDEV